MLQKWWFQNPELGYHVCKRWKGIVLRAIEFPLKKRLQYKQLYRTTDDPELRQLYKQRSDALKQILVKSLDSLDSRLVSWCGGYLEPVIAT